MIKGILAAEKLIVTRAAHVIRSYPKQITGAIAAAFLFGGGGAFAVASLGPDAADLPVKRVFEAVTPLSFADQVEALDKHEFTLFRTEITRSSDTIEALLQRLGIVDPGAAAFIRRNADARTALLSRPGRTVTVEATQDNRLQKISARWIPDGNGGVNRVVLEKTLGGFQLLTQPDTLTPGIRLASGIVRSSLFAATDIAGIPDSVSSQLADIFNGDVDFRALRKGDSFAVVYETFEADGQTLRTGRVLSAEFESGGDQHQVVWFQEQPDQKGGYYRFNGDSLRRAYLASPVEYTRMTSGFAMRLHPIFNSWRQHHGTDFAAPTGTPVRAVGDGVVEFAGIQGGYGNMVILKHRNDQETAYAHLSRIDVEVGQKVSQSQTLGAVGSTGWSTGPHLHFEFRVNGEYRNPTTMVREGGGATPPISAAARPAFDRLATTMRAELSAASSVLQANAN